MHKIKSVALIAISGLLLAGCGPTAGTPTGQMPTAQTAQTEESFSGSMRDLLGMGKNTQCDWSSVSATGGTTSTGKLYVSGKKMFQEVSVTTSDKNAPTSVMNMLSDGNFMYLWNKDGKTPGMKMTITEPTVTPSPKAGQPVAAQGADLDKKYDFKCKGWSVDNSMFAVPTNIQFTDIDALKGSLPNEINLPKGINIPSIPAVPAEE